MDDQAAHGEPSSSGTAAAGSSASATATPEFPAEALPHLILATNLRLPAIPAPMVLSTLHGPVVYSPAQRSYWVRFSGRLPGNVPRVSSAGDAGLPSAPPPIRAVDSTIPELVVPDSAPLWLRIHCCPAPVTISKAEARAFLKAHPTWPQICAAAPSVWPAALGPPSSHPILSPQMLLYHALHDGIIVRRDKTDTGIAQFAVDKLSMPFVRTLPTALPLLRPEFTPSVMSGLVAEDDAAACQCDAAQLEHYGPAGVVYCPGCTTVRQAETVLLRSVASDGKTPVEMPVTKSYRTVCVVGRLTFRKPVADALANFYCADLEKSGRFVVAGTFRCCEMLFHLAPLGEVVKTGVPPEMVLGWVMRDSLFVRRFDDKVVNWAEYYKINDDSLGGGETLLLSSGELDIGTIGAIS